MQLVGENVSRLQRKLRDLHGKSKIDYAQAGFAQEPFQLKSRKFTHKPNWHNNVLAAEGK
jgi:hypothetical protein